MQESGNTGNRDRLTAWMQTIHNDLRSHHGPTMAPAGSCFRGDGGATAKAVTSVWATNDDRIGLA